MKKPFSLLRYLAAAQIILASHLAAPAAYSAVSTCSDDLSRAIPARSAKAPQGSALMQSLLDLGGAARDAAVSAEMLAGNVPEHMRHLTAVSFDGQMANGQAVKVTICVTPDYLAVGSDADYVRIPLGLPAAARIADRFGFLLPTTRMVDAIYAQADVQLTPSPMEPTSQMTTTAYLLRHNHTVDNLRARRTASLAGLTAGQKKDLVLSNRLRSKPGQVAIYGWHRANGRPIQPLSTVHGAQYADYSHGVRLVSQTAFVDGVARPLSDIMQDAQLARIVSDEGPIADATA